MTKYMVMHAAVNVFDADFPKEEALRRHLTRRLRKGQTVDSDVELKHIDLDRLLGLGAIREVTQREAGALEPDEDEDETPEPVDYSEVKYPELQQLAKDRGLSAGGSAADIVARLQEQDAARAEDEAAAKRLTEMQGGGVDPTGQGNGGQQHVQEQ